MDVPTCRGEAPETSPAASPASPVSSVAPSLDVTSVMGPKPRGTARCMDVSIFSMMMV